MSYPFSTPRLHDTTSGVTASLRFWARRLSRHVVALTTVATLAACAGGDGPTAPITPPTPPVTPAPNPEPPAPTPTLGAITVQIENVPSGTEPSVVLRSGSVERVVRQSRTVDSLPPGDYEVRAEPVNAAGVMYDAEPATQVVSVRASQAAPRVSVSFRARGASLVLAATGLPSYARGTVRLSGPGTFSRTALTGDTLRGLPGGNYLLVAEGLETTDGRFEAVPSSRSIALPANGTQSVTFAYGAARAALTIAPTGLPAGALAGIGVTGPGGFAERADSETTFAGLEAGLYTARAARVRNGGFSFDPDATVRDVSITGTQQRTLGFTYTLATGAIAVTAAGLPSGASANLLVTGPSGFSRTLSGTQTLTDLEPGTYRVAALAVTAQGVSYAPQPASLDVVVTPSFVALPAEFQYSGSVGALAIEVLGLPPTMAANVKVTGPAGKVTWITGTDTIEGLAPGSYLVEAQTVSGTSDSWDPEVSARTVNVKQKETTTAGVRYSPRTGALAVSVLGLPSGVPASVRVLGPGSFNRTVTETTTLQGLTPGTYTVSADPVVNGSTQYTASPTSASVSVTRGNTATRTVGYGGVSTSLTVDFSGLPSGTSASATVTGPNGFTRTLTGPAVLENLAAGTYRIVAARVTTSGAAYDPAPATVDVSLSAGQRRTESVAYAIATGSLAVSVAGLPSGTAAAITVSGPNSFSRTLSATQTLTMLAPGAYTVTASTVSTTGGTFAPTPATRTVTVSASLVAAAAPVSYATAVGAVRVTMTGLPSAAAGAATLVGPGTTQSLSQSAIVTGLAAGAWEVRGNTVTVGTDRYAATPGTRQLTVLANDTIDAPISFARVTGHLSLTISGLPQGTSAAVTVTGPDAFSRVVNGSQTLTGLEPGTYAVAAASITSGATEYTASTPSQSISVTAGGNASATVAYTGQTTSLAISVSGVPSGSSAAVTVSGPGSFTRAVGSSTTLVDLAAGTYMVTAARIVAGSYGYTASPASQSVSLTTGDSKSAAVAYAVNTGALTVTVSGLPSGVSAPITVTGPGSFSRTVSATQTLADLAPGTYTIAASTTTSGATSYTPASASQTVSVTAGATAARSVAYTGNGTSLTVTVNGVPTGSSAAVTVTGPGSFSRVLTATTTLSDLAAGTYTVSAATISASGYSYAPTPTSASIALATGENKSHTVTYAATTGRLVVSLSGLPTGTNGAVTVTGPGSFSQLLTATQTLQGLAPGTYTISAANVTASGYVYGGTPASQTVSVSAGAQGAASVAYAATTGRLTVSISGLPTGTNAAVTVTGPGSYSQAVTAGTTLANLAPGTYTVAAANVTASSTLYTPSAASQTVSVTAGATASRSVTYSGSSTSLAVTISGVPSGTNAAVTVTGPSSFSRALTATTTLSGLAAGTYTVAGANISSGGYTYAATPASTGIALATGESKSHTVTYAATTGRLTVSVSGLPTGTNAAVTVTGPGSYSQAVTAGTTLANLAPGTYTVAAANVTASSTLYTPSAASQTVSVTAGATASRSVTYSGSSTSLAVTINGVPSGTNAAVTVTGPSSFSRALSATTTLSSLAAGTYTVSAATLSAGGYSYAPTPTSTAIALATGENKAHTVTYAATTGRLTVSMSGLPTGTSAAVTVTGPGSYSQAITAGTTLSNLVPGTYTVAASNVTASGTTYAPSAASQTVSVTAGATASRSVTYAAQSTGGGGGGSGINLTVESAYVTQAIQSFAGDVPLVVGREALLRVFVTAAATNTLQPTVRVRLYDGATNFRTFTINAPSTSVPTALAEGTLSSSWNATLSESDMRANLRIQVDVDPSNAVSEPDETDNVWPRSGTRTLDMRTVSPFNVVFVPVHQPATGLTGNVTSANLESQYLSLTRRLFPLKDINASVRATFTSNAAALQSNDGNFAWLTVLSEINSLRAADGSSANYYGVVGTSYGSGIAGYGYVPGRAAVGWDKSGSALRVTAHELGHNFGRRHVAACGSGNTDTNYPHSGGSIGLWGWNSASNSIVSPSTHTDIMGYCGTQWISDYTWSSVLTYRASSPMVAGFGATTQTSLLVWGRVVNGVVTLEPTTRVVTRPLVPQAPGRYRLELRDATGRALTGFTFEPDAIDHNDDAYAFAFAVPMDAFTEARLASVAIVGGASGTVEQRASEAMIEAMGGAPAALVTADDGSTQVTDPRATVTAVGSASRVTWDDAAWPMALVRDAATGQVLTYLRASGNQFVPRGSSVRITFSNGIRSLTRELPAR